MRTVGTLMLVASVVLIVMTGNAYAIDDPVILLEIAKRAQEQILSQISDDSPDKVKGLFKEGTQQVDALEEALRDNDVSSAEEYFLSAMKTFKEISKYQTVNTLSYKVADDITASYQDATLDNWDPSNDLQRLQAHVENLKMIAEKYDNEIDFSELDELFARAQQQISDQQQVQAFETFDEIEEIIEDVKKRLQEYASQQESQRALEYAQKYLEQLDRLIENSKNQGISDDIIKRLETAKEELALADKPRQVVEEIRKIIVLKDKFDLTEHDTLESRILQIEKTLSRLSETDEEGLAAPRDMLKDIKQKLNDGEFEIADELLGELLDQLAEIERSL